MPYLLEFCQDDKINTIGIFQSEENVIAFIESIPFVIKEVAEYGTSYIIHFKDLPELYTIQYNKRSYPLSRFSYSAYESSSDIYLVYYMVEDLDSTPEEAMTYMEGSVLLDAYSYDSKDIPVEIERREAFYKDVEQYYASMNRKVARSGLGSQDGEYILVEETPQSNQMQLTYLFDPTTLNDWEKAGSFEQWYKDYYSQSIDE